MMRALLTILICLLSAPSLADSKIDFGSFNQLPILDNGRIKPLGAFAKTRLKDFYGSDKNASAWLAETLFNPAAAEAARIYTIKNDSIKTRFELDKAQDTFSLSELSNGLLKTYPTVQELIQQEQGTLTKDQKALLKIHENVLSYNELLRSFSLLLPLENNKTLQDFLPREQRILDSLKSIIAKKGEDINTYSENEKSTALIGFQIQQLRAGGADNNDFKIIPTRINQNVEWIAPWQIINEGKGSPATSEMLELWSNAAQAYRNHDAQQWNEATKQLLDKTLNISSDSVSRTRLKTELIYQTIKPYHLAMGFYAFSVILMVLSLNAGGARLGKIGFVTLIIALSTHIFAIGARMYILDRPPVGTLYESVLFVSLICAAIAAISYIANRKTLIPLTGQIAALGLLSIAPTMLQNNDSLELLVAVLNTNFWLATHVLIITAGYGVCILAACLAHAYMIIRLRDHKHKLLEGLFQSIHKIGLIALLLTSVGTVLGGIWADQSWGRFWGWDPKENGALLIVLWLIWIQHGRLSGRIRPLGYVAAMAGLNIVVALAWFGVNLLGVGLHSYGFTSGIASGLAVFCILETLIIITIWIAIRTREKNQKVKTT